MIGTKRLFFEKKKSYYLNENVIQYNSKQKKNVKSVMHRFSMTLTFNRYVILIDQSRRLIQSRMANISTMYSMNNFQGQ